MFRAAVWIVVLGFIFKIVIDYRDWLDLDKDVILSVTPGKCQNVIKDGGAEDLTHVGNGLILMSTGLSETPGHIRALNLNKKLEVVTMSISNPPDRPDFMNKPHGLSAWRDPQTAKLYLHVISHASVECVEAFEVDEDKLALKYLKTITDSSFTFMNDLVAVGKDQFYITKFAHFPIHDTKKLNLEWLTRLRTGKIYFYDGEKIMDAVSSLQEPNGINISPDNKVIYVAEWGAKYLRAYKRESTNSLVEIWSKYVATGIDNIEVDPSNGDLWIGSVQVRWKVIDILNEPRHGAKHPAQVLRVKLSDNTITQIEEIFSDDGNFMSGTSVATYVNGKAVIGTVSNTAEVCEINYLSKPDDVKRGAWQ